MRLLCAAQIYASFFGDAEIIIAVSCCRCGEIVASGEPVMGKIADGALQIVAALGSAQFDQVFAGELTDRFQHSVS